jgi:hypothetical protein
MHSLQTQPPQQASITFFIGRDEHGFWTAQGADGREGGLFVSREAAEKFVHSARPQGHGVVQPVAAPLDLWK